MRMWDPPMGYSGYTQALRESLTRQQANVLDMIPAGGPGTFQPSLDPKIRSFCWIPQKQWPTSSTEWGCAMLSQQWRLFSRLLINSTGLGLSPLPILQLSLATCSILILIPNPERTQLFKILTIWKPALGRTTKKHSLRHSRCSELRLICTRNAVKSLFSSWQMGQCSHRWLFKNFKH